MEQPELEVDLGLDLDGNVTHTYTVLQQRHARLIRRLVGKKGVFRSLDEFQELTNLDTEDGGAEAAFERFLHAGEGKVYDVLHVFIPNLMPRYEFEGFASQTAYDEDQYDEDADRSPSVPQIRNAFTAAVEANGLEWLDKVRSFFDSGLLKAEVNMTLAKYAEQVREQMDQQVKKASDRSEALPGSATEKPDLTNGTGSQSSPPPSGESAPTSSGTTGPTRSEQSESEAAVSASPSRD